jgi:hypothetical protein
MAEAVRMSPAVAETTMLAIMAVVARMAEVIGGPLRGRSKAAGAEAPGLFGPVRHE